MLTRLAVLGLEQDRIGPPLVVGPPEAVGRRREELLGHGWVERGSSLARFADGRGERLDLLALPGERLPDLDDLVAGRVPLARELQLRAMAAPARGPAVLEGHRAALHRRLASSGAAWLRAHDATPPSGRQRVVALEAAYDSGLPSGDWPGATIALSGLDGTGKSTQARLLASALHDVSVEAAVAWARVGFSPRLGRLAAPVKRLLHDAPATGPQDDVAELSNVLDPTAGPEPTGDARRTAQRRAAVDAAWSLLVGMTDATEDRSRLRTHARAGRVLVRDRYVLDSLVHLAERYGEPTSRGAGALVRRLTPPAAAAFLLEVPAAVAHARKPGEWSVEDLERHARRYDALADDLGVVRVDARRPPAEVAGEIARRVWRSLP